MAQTIEDVNGRTVLQQFHSLYKNQTETDKNVKNLDTKIEQEKSDRKAADQGLQKLIYQEATEIGNETASLRNDLNTNTNKIEYNSTQITALKSGKQDKLTAGANITIDENNVISASGGLTKVVATDVDSESATSGQVLTANGNGGASWQNASGEKLYEHIIRVDNSSAMLCILYTKSNTVFTANTLCSYFVNRVGKYDGVSFTGPTTKYNSTNLFYPYYYTISGNTLKKRSNFINFSIVDGQIVISESRGNDYNVIISDTVTEL